AAGEPQLARRAGQLLAPRLVRASAPALVPPRVAAWQLASAAPGTLDALVLREVPAAALEPGPGEVTVAIRAAGLNFRDVLVALGMYPTPDVPIGGEGAGVVTAIGDGVTDLAIGDRVLGLLPGAMGTAAVTDRRRLARLPEGWSFAQGAAIPTVYLTAWYGLIELGGLRPGQRVLIHAAAGGVGAAALEIARHAGAEVFATASPGKWDVLRAQGIDDAHLASSRDRGFAERFAGIEMDLVLNSLAGELIDASLGLLGRGGRFIELGKRDLRPAAEIEAAHGVHYLPFDLTEVDLDLVAQMLGELLRRFAGGVLGPPRPTVRDVREAPEAFRVLGAGHLVGKLVLSMPPRLDPDGAVLITGGTGTLAAGLARHLVARHGVRHLVLASRRGAEAPGARALADELAALGAASVELAACDVASREELAALLGSLPRRLTGIVHAAGITDDGVIAALTPDRIDTVLRGKADAALHLSELTSRPGGPDPELFVMYSSVSGVLGGPGQGNYAAANAFLDGLAEARRREGRAALALAWGLWREASGITGSLDERDWARMARAGVEGLSTERGLALFDAALGLPAATLVPVGLDVAVLRSSSAPVSSMLRELARAPAAAAAAGGAARTAPGAGGSFARALRELPEGER
ncbi:MAG TPA: SDR family NAD(P)-dependent oxidoreductase, partial [Kofleriaceae bacterium]|nr:SDR family NAD(P)-dependent oxidoreductase [Kofleriaceae bacterium]